MSTPDKPMPAELKAAIKRVSDKVMDASLLEQDLTALVRLAMQHAPSQSAVDARHATPRACWQDGLEAAAHYIENSTFQADQIETVQAAAALIRSLKNNTMFGPKHAEHQSSGNATTDQLQVGVNAYQGWKANVGNECSSAYGGNLHDLARRMYEAMINAAPQERSAEASSRADGEASAAKKPGATASTPCQSGEAETPCGAAPSSEVSASGPKACPECGHGNRLNGRIVHAESCKLGQSYR